MHIVRDAICAGAANSVHTAGRPRRGEDIAGDAYVEHSFTHKSTQSGLVPASTQSNQPHFAGLFGRRARQDIATAQANFIGEGEDHPLQQLRDQVLRIVDELFHSHTTAFSIYS